MSFASERSHLFRTVAPRLNVFEEGDRTIALMQGRPFVSE